MGTEVRKEAYGMVEEYDDDFDDDFEPDKLEGQPNSAGGINRQESGFDQYGDEEFDEEGQEGPDEVVGGAEDYNEEDFEYSAASFEGVEVAGMKRRSVDEGDEGPQECHYVSDGDVANDISDEFNRPCTFGGKEARAREQEKGDTR